MGGRRCKKCGQQTGPDRRLCKMCSLDKRYGNDFESAADVDDEPEELEYRCVECGHEQVGTLSDHCEECGARRWRYIGPLPGEDETDHEERIATDGGAKDLIPARVDYDDLIGADCPVCGEEMMPGAIRFNGRAWEHKSDEAHPQAGHHRISEPLDEDEEKELRADGGQGPDAFLGEDAHWCDLCDRAFDSLKELANHTCRATPEPEVEMITREGPAGKTVLGPDPAAFQEWEEQRQEGGAR